jgi:acyl-CoA synthetase (AMP-forming)/AMP-acid ligase II
MNSTDKSLQSNAARLRAHGTTKPNECTVLYFDTHRDNIIWYWSVVAAGGVPAILSALSNNEATLAGELDNVSKLFHGPTILTTKRLAKNFRLFASLTTVTVETIATTKHPEKLTTRFADAESSHKDNLATVLFTSGSTGFAKGVEYTHSQLVTSSKLKCNFHCMDSNKTFLCWVSKYSENHDHCIRDLD